MHRLSISYDPEDGWHGELTAAVQSGGFAGRSAAWFSIGQLRAFGDKLGAFPIAPGEEPALGGGFWESDNELDQTHLSIRIEPAGPKGKLRVKVTLATPPWNLGRSDQQSVQAQFLVNYADLGVFQRDFSSLPIGNTQEAVLEATPT